MELLSFKTKIEGPVIVGKVDIENIDSSAYVKGINYEKTKCFYCERNFKVCQKTVEHIVPQSLGGSNTACNKVNACYDCNSWKGSLMIHDFITKVKKTMKAGKTHKTIPDYLLRVILINCARLKLYVDEKGQKLYAKQNITNPYAEPKKKKLKQIVKELGFSDNPIIMEAEIKEYQTYLQHQTPEQFTIAKQHGWKIAKLLTESEQIFHYEQ